MNARHCIGCAWLLVVGACGGLIEDADVAPHDGGSATPDASGASGADRADAEPSDVASVDAAACTTTFGSKVVAHICSHTQGGPYDTVVAGSDPLLAPSVDRIHVPYEIVLERADAAGPYHGFVRYTPSRPSRHGLAISGATTLLVRHGKDAVDAELESPLWDCPSIDRGLAVSLELGETYLLELTSDARIVIFFAEHLEAFEEPFEERCE